MANLNKKCYSIILFALFVILIITLLTIMLSPYILFDLLFGVVPVLGAVLIIITIFFITRDDEMKRMYFTQLIGTILVPFWPVLYFIYKLTYQRWTSLEYIVFTILEIPFGVCIFIGLELLCFSLYLVAKSQALSRQLPILYSTSIGLPLYFTSMGDGFYYYAYFWTFLGDIICFGAIFLFILSLMLVYKNRKRRKERIVKNTDL